LIRNIQRVYTPADMTIRTINSDTLYSFTGRKLCGGELSAVRGNRLAALLGRATLAAYFAAGLLHVSRIGSGFGPRAGHRQVIS
jgi:hypothetical protein